MTMLLKSNLKRHLKIGLLASFIYVIVCVGFATAVFAATAIIVKNDDVNLRSAPGTNSSIITTVPKGQRFQVLETKGDWYKVTFGQQTGWIAGWMVETATADSTPTQQTQQQNSAGKTKQATITADSVNVRSGPGSSYSTITTVNKGAKFSVAGTSGQWVKINLPNGKTGWVAGWLSSVSETAAPNANVAANQPAANNQTAFSSTAVVNNQTAANSTATSGNQSSSTAAKVSTNEANAQLNGGVIGWVSGLFLNTQTAEASPAPGDPAVETKDTDQTNATNQPNQPAAPVLLDKVGVSEKNGHTYITLTAHGPLNYDMFMLTNPDRLVLDLKNVTPTDMPETTAINSAAVSQLRTGWMTQEPPVLRLVFDLQGSAVHLDSLSDDRTKLNLDVFIPEPGCFLKGHVIAIDAGHGGSDPGAIGPDQLKEKDVNLDIALRLRQVLTASGAQVIMTRSDDSYVGLEERTAIADQNRAEVFLSIHSNASTKPDANGTSSYYRRDTGDLAPGISQDDNRRLASLVQSELLRTLGLRSLGVLQANYVVLRTATTPAVLAEVAFISNYGEEQMLSQDATRQNIAEALGRALNSYFAPNN
ncbi:MAG: N-acetylmuramoyl-L-alanine amidase [Firmicutes bacterium]|nr:N-acetylmuramoyl-L-alanine amidase [Bacillota bacterium]